MRAHGIATLSCWWKVDKGFRHDQLDERGILQRQIDVALLRVYRIREIYVSDAISEREHSASHKVIMKKICLRARFQDPVVYPKGVDYFTKIILQKIYLITS